MTICAKHTSFAYSFRGRLYGWCVNRAHGSRAMELNQVSYFINLAETLNFTAAARLSSVSQPSLTRAIRRLEEELGGPLIHRDGKNSRLTGLGHDVEAEFRRMAVAVKSVRDHSENWAMGRHRVLDVGVAPTVGPRKFAAFFESALAVAGARAAGRRARHAGLRHPAARQHDQGLPRQRREQAPRLLCETSDRHPRRPVGQLYLRGDLRAQFVFDPLFTTTENRRDPLGSGMGLGLALVRRGAEAFGGKAELVAPPPGFATCIEIRLPNAPGDRAG